MILYIYNIETVDQILNDKATVLFRKASSIYFSDK